MKQAIIFALESSPVEPNYEKMAILKVKSLRSVNPDVDVFCGLFTNRTPSQETLSQLTSMGVYIIHDCVFETGTTAINYFLRNFCCHYFSQRLLDEYEQLIYLDIDVLVLQKLDITIPTNSILVERVPDSIVKREYEYIGNVDFPLYYNWVSVVNRSNRHIFDIDYKSNMLMKDSDLLISQNINISGLKIIDQHVGAYYPKHSLTSESMLFHYDGFIDSGTFFKLKDHNHELYRKYQLYIIHVLGIYMHNDEEYWNGF